MARKKKNVFFRVTVKAMGLSELYSRKFLLIYPLPEPQIELHGDGQTAFTWRSPIGIINIAFRVDGVATWAAYLPGRKDSTKKGRFDMKGDEGDSVYIAVPTIVIVIILEIMGERKL